MMKKCFIFHDWGNFVVIDDISFYRTCLKCGIKKVIVYPLWKRK